MPLTIVVFSSNLVSESINAPTTFASAFLRAFCDASSKVEPKPFVITVFTLLFEAIKLLPKFLWEKLNSLIHKSILGSICSAKKIRY